MYAELMGNYKKRRIKSQRDNKMMLSWAQAFMRRVAAVGKRRGATTTERDGTQRAECRPDRTFVRLSKGTRTSTKRFLSRRCPAVDRSGAGCLVTGVPLLMFVLVGNHAQMHRKRLSVTTLQCYKQKQHGYKEKKILKSFFSRA